MISNRLFTISPPPPTFPLFPGFPDNKQASLYCKLPTSIDIPCCASVIHSHQQTTSSSPSPLDSSSSSSSPAFLKGTGLSLPAFIGIVVGSGILLMIFVGVSVCLCRRRKGGRRSGRIQEQGSIKNNNNHNNSNGLGTLQRPLTLTRTSPPGLSHGAAFDHRTPTAFRTPPRNAGGGGGFSSSVNNNNNTNSTDLSSARPNRNPHLATMYPTNIKYRVTADYIPEMHDELDLRVGDIILLNVVYPDFWGFGFNEVTGLEGIVPLGLLSRIMERGK